MRSRQLQNDSGPSCVRPRKARWKAWEWTFASPGSVRPSSLVAPSGGWVTPGVTAAKRSSFTSNRTSGVVRVPPSQACRAHQVGTRSGPEAGDEAGGPGRELVALEPLELLPGGKGGRIGDPVDEEGAVEVI